MAATATLKIRPATESDRPIIQDLIDTSSRLHQHLDWTGPLELIGSSPFLLALQGGSLAGCLACPSEPQGPAWVRLFAAADPYPLATVWKELWRRTSEILTGSDSATAAVLCLSNWLAPLAEGAGFRPQSGIIFLEWRGGSLDKPERSVGVIRAMERDDAQAVLEVDNLAFGYLWTMSARTLARAYDQATYVTVCELEGEIVGYQLSTSSVYGAHLARLAVAPEVQGRGVGSALVQDLLVHFRETGIARVTVNTQTDNYASLALYERLGFESTDHTYPIYVSRLIAGK